MSVLTFRGGTHPYDGKALSRDAAIEEIKPGEELVFPLSQHIGAPAVPIVEIGERVLAGQKIAAKSGFRHSYQDRTSDHCDRRQG